MKIAIEKIFSFAYKKDYFLQNFAYGNYEMIYFKTGEGKMTINNIEMQYHPNDICFMSANSPRCQLSTEYSEYICVRFRLLEGDLPLESGVYTSKSTDIFHLFSSILAEYCNKDYEYFEMCNLKAEEILIMLIRLTAIKFKETNDITTLIKEIDSTLLFNRSVGEMAESLHYSPDYFRHKFKNITGQSPVTYIINKRIEHACELLSLEKYSCTEISQLLGFSSSSQFSKIFKRETGISPISYQKRPISK